MRNNSTYIYKKHQNGTKMNVKNYKKNVKDIKKETRKISKSVTISKTSKI